MKFSRIAPGIALIVLALALVPVALAGKGGGGKGGGGSTGGTTGGSYTVTVTPGGPYVFGEQIYVTTDVPTTLSPYIWLKCYQGTTLVMSSDHSGSPTGWYYGWPFDLGPTQSWGMGSANCTVTVVHISSGKTVTDASTSFSVAG